jgi:CO dehydrogenase/acetyl-CoA synthase gamma subunit (corrinoid Fe-S protein)
VLVLSVDDKIKDIVEEEFKRQLAEFEESLKEYLADEFQDIREELSDIFPRTRAVEEGLEEKIDLLVRFRKHTLDQLMAEIRCPVLLLQAEKGIMIDEDVRHKIRYHKTNIRSCF